MWRLVLKQTLSGTGEACTEDYMFGAQYAMWHKELVAQVQPQSQMAGGRDTRHA